MCVYDVTRSTGAITEIVEVCCSAGMTWAVDHERCDNLYGVLPAVEPHDVVTCRGIMEVCCLKSKQTAMCQLGMCTLGVVSSFLKVKCL